MATKSQDLPVLGWREWVALPALGVNRIQCKVDTGARTSALHAFYVESFERDDREWVRFGLHPRRGNTEKEIHCEAEIAERRIVSDSGGHKEERIVIVTPIVLGRATWPVELTLTNRDTMRFRMLLGRTAMANSYLVAPGERYLMGKPAKHPLPHALVTSRYRDEEE